MILNEMHTDEMVRLIGIRLDNLVSNSFYQTSLFEDINDKKSDEKLDKVVDDLKKKYGSKVIDKASLK